MKTGTYSLPELGLVCITASKQVRYRTVTRKRLLQLTPSEQATVLHDLYADNLQRLHTALDFCQAAGIHLYRLTSALFPFADQPVGAEVLQALAEGLPWVGKRAEQLEIRVVLHPDPFVVLSSDRPEVIQTSVQILSTHAEILDRLGLPRSPWTAMNIHGGKGDRRDRLIKVIQDLPPAIATRLTLENDEYSYSAAETVAICQQAGVPMVFDAHHHLIHEQLDSYDHPSMAEMLLAARSTWPDPAWQLVHISNGEASLHDPRHSDLITTMPSAYRNAPWIEVEAKHKEQAIAQLRQTWLSTLASSN